MGVEKVELTENACPPHEECSRRETWFGRAADWVAKDATHAHGVGGNMIPGHVALPRSVRPWVSCCKSSPAKQPPHAETVADTAMFPHLL